jgi:glycosyltransferase involved in cell wall biosynthesis
MLVAGQIAAGVQVEVLLVTDERGAPPALVGVLEAAGATVCQLALPDRAYLREYREVRDWLRLHRPDILHTHGYRVDVIAGRAARGQGIATVSTLHGFTGGDWKNRMYERIQLHTLRRADAVIAVSRPIRERLVGIGFEDGKIHVIPNAWGSPSSPLPRAEARAALGIPPEARVLGWVGRLSREKGADLLLEALARVQDGAVTCSVIGDGPRRSELVAQAEALGLSGRVRWHGLVPDAARFLPAFDAFVLSSRTEGTPIALFEAMAAGVPIVATRVGGVPDVVSPEEALLVPSEDPAALATAVDALLAEPDDAARRALAAAARLAGTFALEPWLRRHDALYHTILARRRAGAA